MRDQTHLGFASCAGGHIEDRESLIVEAGADALEHGGIGGECALAFFDELIERDGAGGFAGE